MTGAISEIRLWQLAEAVPGSIHRFKYSLFYGYPDAGRLGMTMSGARRTIGIEDGLETSYRFASLDNC